MTRDPHALPVTSRTVFTTWWPLAVSWLLMAFELPMISAVIARLPDARVNLAAYGGVVFPTALMIEAPVVMLLSASTALSRDEASYRLGRRFMLTLGLTFVSLHALVAFTPLFDVLAGTVLGVPLEVREPARLGLRLMTPWTLSIAYRRFQQGVLIRFGRPQAMSIGTAVRLGANGLVLLAGYAYGRLPGIAVGTAAIAIGVMAEAVYAGLAVRPVRFGALRAAPAVTPPLTRGAYGRFYLPLMMTPMLAFLGAPLTSAALSRMPEALGSLAAWPVALGLLFTMRSLGFAYNEVVVALLDRPHALAELTRFARRLAIGTSATLLLIAATPLGTLWLHGMSALPADLTALGLIVLWVGTPTPWLNAYQSLYQGVIVHSRATRAITESMVVFLGVTALTLGAGVLVQRLPGVWFAAFALVTGNLALVGWLWRRSRAPMRALARLDAAARA
jgi:hypothetical protein